MVSTETVRLEKSRRGFLRTAGLIATTAALGSVAGCTTSSSTDENSTSTTTVTADATVEVGPSSNQFAFVPGTDAPLHVSKGATVLWIWKSDTHNIVVGNQPDNADWNGTPGGSGDVYDEGYSYRYAFERPGKYHYWCEPHKSTGMVADLIVE